MVEAHSGPSWPEQSQATAECCSTRHAGLQDELEPKAAKLYATAEIAKYMPQFNFT